MDEWYTVESPDGHRYAAREDLARILLKGGWSIVLGDDIETDDVAPAANPCEIV